LCLPVLLSFSWTRVPSPARSSQRDFLLTAYDRSIVDIGVLGDRSRGTPVYPGLMRAVTIVEERLEWLEHPDPEPGPGEVLVSVRAAGINAADLLQRRGFYPAPPGSPQDIPGMEFAGEVVGLGPGATRLAIGDRVMSITGGGGQAQMAVI
jgi:hypothetical protein